MYLLVLNSHKDCVAMINIAYDQICTEAKFPQVVVALCPAYPNSLLQ